MSLKKVYRLYRKERLTVRKRGGRKRALGTRRLTAIPQESNQRWSLDFASDALAGGSVCVRVIAGYRRECLATAPATDLNTSKLIYQRPESGERVKVSRKQPGLQASRINRLLLKCRHAL